MFDFKTYLCFAKQNIFSVLIKIGGLAFGIATSLIFSLYIYHEMSFDGFWQDSDNIWRIDTVESVPGRTPIFVAGTPAKAGLILPDNFPEITSITRGIINEIPMKSMNDPLAVQAFIADDNFLSFFNFPMKTGDAKRAIYNNNLISISETTAQKYFGSEDPIGKTLTLMTPTATPYQVSSVFRDLPNNSHFKFDVVVRLHESVTESMAGAMDNWGNPSFKTYVKVKAGTKINDLEAKFPAFLQTYFPADFAAAFNVRPDDLFKFKMIRLDELHLYGAPLLSMKPRANIELLQIFTAVSILVLVSSAFNFVNLSIVMALKRSKEVALRKVVGASRLRIIIQFLIEHVVIGLVAFLLALGVAELMVPIISLFVSESLPFNLYDRLDILAVLCVLATFLGIIIGLYPAAKMTAIRPGSVLRSNRSRDSGTEKTKTSLTFMQFILSNGLLVAMAIILSQLKYIEDFDHQFTMKNILILQDIPNAETNAPILKNAISSLTAVESVGRSSFVPLSPSEHNMRINSSLGGEPIIIGFRELGEDLLNTYGINTLAGRMLSDDRDTLNDGNTQGVMLNKAALLKLGFVNPEDAIGQYLYRGKNNQITMEIVGIIDDVYLNSIHREVRDEIYLLSPNTNVISVLYDPVVAGNLMQQIENIWKDIVPDSPLKAEYIETHIQRTYQEDYNNGYLISILAFMAVLIANLGLYAISALSVQNTYKEIAIRKIVGAGGLDILKLLFWRLLMPVGLANVIAWPVAYMLMDDWLSGFSHHITMNWYYFLFAAAVNLMLAAGTIVSHVWRASRRHPHVYLRQE